MLLLLVIAQELNADYVKESRQIQKDAAKAFYDLAAASAKGGRLKAARFDLQTALELDPDHAKAKEVLGKIQGQADTVKGEDKAYLKKRAKLREETAKKFDALAKKATDKGWTVEAEDAQKHGDELRAAADVAPPTVAELMIRRLNEIRASLSLAPCEFDDALSNGCGLHAEYLVKNDGHESTSGLGAHNEDATLPGYTPEGEKAGHASCISFANDGKAVDNLIDTFYHRIPLISPRVLRAGAGAASGGTKYKNVSLIDCQSNRDGKPDAKTAVIAYPPDGAKEVGTSFHGEGPDPIPEEAKRPVGYPVTLTFFDRQKVTEVLTADLLDGGKSVACYVSTPEMPARKDHGQSNTICFLPKEPLSAKTTYTVKVACKVNGAKFEKTWSFTTK